MSEETWTQTKFGMQPVAAIIRHRGYTIRGFARANGIDGKHLQNVCVGRVTPNAQDREVIPRVLDLPLAQLFNYEALDATPLERVNP